MGRVDINRATAISHSDLIGEAAALKRKIQESATEALSRVNALRDDLAPAAFSGDYADLANTPALSAVATSGAYADLTGKPALGALASLDSITTAKVSNWSSATSGFLTSSSLTPYAKTADLATVATSGAYSDLSGKPTIPTVPTNVSAFTNDAGYLSSHQDISGLLAKSGGTMSGAILVSGAFSSGFVRQTVTDSYTMLSGGTTANTGAVLILSGGTRQSYAGMFRLSARTSSGNKKDLDGWSDGTLTWDGEKIAVASDLATKQDLLAVEEVQLTFPEVTEFSARDITCYRYGKLVMLNIHVTLSAAISAATVVASGLPLPARETRQVVCTWASSYRRPIRARITAAGELTFQYGYATMYSHVLAYLAA